MQIRAGVLMGSARAVHKRVPMVDRAHSRMVGHSSNPLLSFGPAVVTRDVVRRIQEDGTCWCGATEWQGHTAMRISVSSWATTEADVDRSLEAMVRIAGECGA